MIGMPFNEDYEFYCFMCNRPTGPEDEGAIYCANEEGEIVCCGKCMTMMGFMDDIYPCAICFFPAIRPVMMNDLLICENCHQELSKIQRNYENDI